jgi:hypothetical protein
MQEMLMITRIATPRALLLSCLIMLSSGCGLSTNQLAAEASFASAVNDFTILLKDEFPASRDEIIEMNTLRLKLDPNSTVDRKKLDGPLTIERIKTRLDAVEALARYAQLLHTLATGSSGEDLKASSDALIQSLRGLQIKQINLSDEQAGAISSLIQAIGKAATDRMRKAASRRIVDAATPAINALADVVKKEFAPTGAWDLAYKEFTGFLDTDIETAEAAVRRAPNDSATRFVAQDAKVLSQRSKDRLSSFSAKIVAACDSLKVAQSKLADSLHSTDISIGEINDFGAHVQDLLNTYRLLRHKPA